MSENQNCGINDFSKYDSMTTQELEEILRLDAEAPEGQASDGELLLYVMGVLEERKQNSDDPGKTAQKAWESFEKHYLPDEEDAHTAQSGRKTPRLRRWIAAVAAAAVLVAIPLTASALTWDDIWNAVARWAKDTFSFVSESEPHASEPATDDVRQFTSLQQALAQTGQDFNAIPTWIPDGYKLNAIKIDENPIRKNYVALYLNAEGMLMITVQSHIASDPEKVEISENLLESYEKSGTTYYIFSNMNQLRTVWIKDSYECSISGDLTIEEIKMMIDSIGKG